MSTSAIHARPESSWKQEVNRRLAEHRGRNPGTPAEPQTPAAAQQSAASRRAQEAAARVAARYAKAPSYSEVLAAEARAALRAAEAATEAALQARAAAESVLANIEAAAAAMPAPEHIMAPAAVEPFVLEPIEVTPQNSPSPEAIAERPRKQKTKSRANEGQPLTIRWASELPARSATAAAELHEGQGQSFFEEEWWRPASAEPVFPGIGEIDMVDPALPIYGNLIEFPRELVATRKVRPRLAESPNADASHVQLSIFEVDPQTVATEPSADAVQASGAEWTQPAWSGIEFDAQPLEQYEEFTEKPAPRTQTAHQLQTASFSRRIMALVMDGVIIAGALVSAAALMLNKSAVLPSIHSMEQISAAALVVISALYITLFYAIAPVTPGMKYARVQICTFDGLTPTPAQRWGRLGAMLLSVLPAGLGLAWSLFDDDNLSWHDRLSKTYVCNR